MSIKTIFTLTNNFTQSGSVGICTAASYAWAKATLKKGKSLKKRSEYPDDHVLNAQMAVTRTLDASPADQVERAGLRLVSSHTPTTAEEVVALGKINAGKVVIFWNSHHTMGYRYAHRCKEYFDMEAGLFRATKTTDVVAKIKEVFAAKGYAPISGAHVVSL